MRSRKQIPAQRPILMGSKLFFCAISPIPSVIPCTNLCNKQFLWISFWCIAHTGIAGYLGSDQALCLQKGTMGGTAWSTETVVKALKLKLSCRSQGYNVARELGMPLPSEPTLQKKLEGFKFAPGLLFEVIDLLKIKVCTVPSYSLCSYWLTILLAPFADLLCRWPSCHWRSATQFWC